MAVISGFVFYDNGTPVNGATVNYYAAVEGTPSSSLGNTTTNANGFWTFTGLAAGRYDVRISWDSAAHIRWVKGLAADSVQEATFTVLNINDTTRDHQYTFVAAELASNQNIALPLMTANGTMVVSNMPDNYDFISASAWQLGTATRNNGQGYDSVGFADNADQSAFVTGYFKRAPSAVRVVAYCPATGNVAYYTATSFAASGEAYNANTDSEGTGAAPLIVAWTANQVNSINIIASFTGAAAGDYFGLQFNRDGADAGDTTSNAFYVLGLLIEY